MTDTILKDQAAHDAAASVADYEHGWSSPIETEFAPKGLTEDTVRFISAKKDEPQWMLDWRLKAFALWQTMEAPDWAKLEIEVDRVMFCEQLDQVRIIRNNVMHFDPDGVGETELTQLRDCTRFLQQLMTVLGRTT